MCRTSLLFPLVLCLAVPVAAGPNSGDSKASAQKSCAANLLQLRSATEQYAMDHKKTRGAAVATTDLVGADRYLKKMPQCPSGGAYRLLKVGTNPTCSIAGHLYPNLRPPMRK